MNKDKILLDRIAEDVAAMGGRLYAIGGYPRDIIAGRENKDIDVEIHGLYPEQLRSILARYGEVRTQGACFGIYNLKGVEIDFSLPRRDSKVGAGHRDFESHIDPNIGVVEAARRRDFTMNTIMLDWLSGRMWSDFGGVDDVKASIIRVTDPDTFTDDPLRVLRAAQFAARFGYSIVHDTIELCSRMDLSALSDDRVYKEMRKALLKSSRPSVFFEYLRVMGQLSVWFPELEALIGCAQNPAYHPEGDVWIHTMQVLDHAAEVRHLADEPEFFMVAALCHDLGKPSTTAYDAKGELHAIGHEKAGVEIAERFLKRINRNVRLCKYVTNMVAMHMTPRPLYDNRSDKVKLMRMCDRTCSINDLVLLSSCDSYRKLHIKGMYEAYLDWRNELQGDYSALMSQPNIGGKELFAIGVPQGEAFRTILNESHELQLAGKTKDEIFLHVVRKYASVYPTVADYKARMDAERKSAIITGNDLIAIGIKPGKEFKVMLAKANAMLEGGVSKDVVLSSIA